MKPHEKLRAFWEERGDSEVFSTTHDQAAVDAAERRLAVSLPPEFQEYLLLECPTGPQPGNMDSHNTVWWPITELKLVPDECEHDLRGEIAGGEDAAQSVFFADYMLWCMAWAICCAPGPDYGRVLVVNGSNDRFIADSFSAFIDAWLKDPMNLI